MKQEEAYVAIDALKRLGFIVESIDIWPNLFVMKRDTNLGPIYAFSRKSYSGICVGIGEHDDNPSIGVEVDLEHLAEAVNAIQSCVDIIAAVPKVGETLTT